MYGPNTCNYLGIPAKCPYMCGECKESDRPSGAAAVDSKAEPKSGYGAARRRNPTVMKAPLRDYNRNCAQWAGYGECRRNPGYMCKKCQKSCAGKAGC